MKKGLAIISVLLLAAAPSAVLAKGKKAHHAKPKAAMAAPANPNANSANMVGDGLHQLVVPLEKITGGAQAAAPKAAAKVRHAKRHKRVSRRAAKRAGKKKM